MDNTAPKYCRNCGNIIENNFCSHCGQATSSGRLSVKVLSTETLLTVVGDNPTNDGIHYRYGILGTLKELVLHPGTTIGNYISGKRRRYFAPITMLILVSTLFVLIHSLCKISLSAKIGIDITPSDAVESLNAAKAQNLYRDILRYIIDLYQQHPAFVQLLTLLFIAYVYKLMFHKVSHYNYTEYFYVGIFISIISMLLSTIATVTGYLLPATDNIASYTATTITAIYEIVVYHSIFALSWRQSVTKYIGVIAIIYGVMSLLAIATVVAIMMLVVPYWL